MKVRDEINKYASEVEKPILLYLLDKYHWQSQWNFVASCTFEGRSPGSKRIWHPTEEGRMLYNYYMCRPPEGATKEIKKVPTIWGYSKDALGNFTVVEVMVPVIGDHPMLVTIDMMSETMTMDGYD